MTCAVQVCVFALALAVASGTRAAQLAENEWRPVEVGEIEVPPDAGLFVNFGDDGKLEGYGGCNRFFGAYKLAGNRVKIGSMGAAMMACPEPIMEREKRLLQALEAASRFARHGADLVPVRRRGKFGRPVRSNGCRKALALPALLDPVKSRPTTACSEDSVGGWTRKRRTPMLFLEQNRALPADLHR